MGKTTAARRLIAILQKEGVPVGGFTTEEIREGGRRVGFAVESTSGDRGILAHVDFAGLSVGRYGVDLATFERIALDTLSPGGRRVVVVDELGKMELASPRFRDAVQDLFETDTAVVATVHTFSHPFTDALKARLDVEVVTVTPSNRDRIPARLADRLRRTLEEWGD